MDEAHLTEAIAKHQLWLETRGREGTRAELSQARLERVDLAGVNLSFACLSEADLRGADLSGANLSRADLNGAVASGTDLCQADLSGANLHLAHLGRADLSEANLRGANLHLADLSEANLRGAHLALAYLCRADLRRANLSRADLADADLHLAQLSEANLRGAHLLRAHLSEANLSEAELSGADLSGARLCGANLQHARLAEARLAGADLSGASVYGMVAWGVVSDQDAECRGLVITPGREPAVTADDIEVAQVVHLLRRNRQLRGVIETVTARVVLIIGRFRPGQEPVLAALKSALRQHAPALVPLVYDVQPPSQLSSLETVALLAQMARLVLVDLSAATLVLQELPHILRHARTPVVAVAREGGDGTPVTNLAPGAFPAALPVLAYRDAGQLPEAFGEAVRAAVGEAGREPRR